MDNSLKDHSGLNPMYHKYSDSVDKFQNLDTDSDQVGTNSSNLHALDINKMRSIPCFNALIGTCKIKFCYYSHDKDLLHATYDKCMKELSSSPVVSASRSPYSNSGKTMGDQRRNISFQASPFTPAGKTPARPLREIYEESPTIPPPEDDSDRVHRSGSRFSSATPLPEPPTQVSILNRNVV